MKVVFDTDPGIDDAMALLYLHACNDIELLGITTTLGNASLDDCTNNALYLCERFNIDAPVYRGAETGIDGSVPTDYPDFVHGGNGLADHPVKVTSRSTEKQHASTFLSDITAANPGKITIIAVGRLTNIALAIQSDPEFTGNVDRVIFMGGAWQCEGNVTPWAEANIIGDPEAAAIVFDAGIPLTMVGLDVTLQTRMTAAYLQSLCQGLGSLGEFLLEINAVYGDYYRKSQGWEAFPVHDSSAVAFADQADVFTTQRGTLNCELAGEQRGRTVFIPTDNGAHQVCVEVASEIMLARYLKTTHEKHLQ
jgi:inosine-uridine nucleoside N-ribohydrolase